MRVLTEDEYLSQQGAGMGHMGDAALHRQPGSTPKSRDRHAKRQAAEDHQLIIRRQRLREEYAELVASGEIRTPTAVERRIKTARGHSDNASVQAARRLLAKRGIDW